MKLIKKKKLEIFIESTYEINLLKIFKANNVSTYACLPTEHYHGKQITSIEDDIIDVFEFSMCVAVVDIDSHRKIIEEIDKVLLRANGVMYCQDIEEIESQ
jgi:hypothetical protein